MKLYKVIETIKDGETGLNLNGGKYDEWRELFFTPKGILYHSRERSSFDGKFCEYCGVYGHDTYDQVIDHGHFDAEGNFEESSDYAHWLSSDIIVEKSIIIPLDAKKLRRRVRDSINKTSDISALIKCANFMAVKLD